MQRKETTGTTPPNEELLFKEADIHKRWEEYIGEKLFKDDRPMKPTIEISEKMSKITIEKIKVATKSLARLEASHLEKQGFYKPWD